ncbi:MAG: hypothetical protein NTZ68_04130 [Candidatus Dependentiae bacterium]|nr:hypothetical protein [Candidatus Dependentiae bacterium]
MNFKYFYLHFLCLFAFANSSMLGMYRLPATRPLPPSATLGYGPTSTQQLPESPQATISPERLRQLQEESSLGQSQQPVWTEQELIPLQVPSSGASTGAFGSTRVNLAPMRRQGLMSRQQALETLGLSEKDLEVSAVEDSLKRLNLDKSLLVAFSALGLRNKSWVKKAVDIRRSAQSAEEGMAILEAIIVLVRLDNLNHYSLDFLENIFPQLLNHYVKFYSDRFGNYNGPLLNREELLDAAKNAAEEVRFRQEAVARILKAEAHEKVRIIKNSTADTLENLKKSALAQGSSWWNKFNDFFNPSGKRR